MLNISEDLDNFITLAFNDYQQTLLREAFGLLEAFTLPEYEDKYLQLLYDEDGVDPTARNSLFLDKMEKDLVFLIEQHAITLTKDSSIALEDLVEILNMLVLLPNLENMSTLRYRVLSEEEPRMLFIQLLEHYTSVPLLKAMELIEDVSQSLIDSMKELCGEECDDVREEIDRNHQNYIVKFFNFINHTECMGLDLHRQGYSNKLTVEELLRLIPTNMEEHIDNKIIRQPAETALDVLSILIITKDEYEIPLTKFKSVAELFTSNSLYITRLTHMMLGIVNDFGVYLEACKQQEKLDGHE